ncbi:peroxidase family protein [Rhizobium alarense]|uniref:peroxidase family protein n=1 Tax=Rhizobium alarense TaxID=2846851 RepID=UPI002E32B3A2|nr:peroxidase family protein [Rhizobium alarense]
MVAATLKNGRRPQLDLDSLYGDGPGLIAGANGAATAAQALYEADYKFRLQDVGPTHDLPRPRSSTNSHRSNERAALIADARNDENINISQLHAAFLAFHNAVMDGLKTESKGKVTGAAAFVRARQLVRWTYQYLVGEIYLKTVCHEDVVSDVLRNGPSFYGSVAGGLPLFMPLEFSVAAFRFGHSMIRPEYRLRDGELTIRQILGVSVANRPMPPDILARLSDGPNAFALERKFTVDWKHFFGPKAVNFARRIDTLIADELNLLPFVKGNSVMAHLAQRNLLRALSLSIPTGQAVAAACGIIPLNPEEICRGEDDDIVAVLTDGGFLSRTPLWYYVLREAAIQTGGETLGVVGSRIVAECIIGLLKKDQNSYINQYGIARSITKEGIEVPLKGGRFRIGSIEAFLFAAGVYPEGGSCAEPVKPRDRLTV